MSVLREYFHSEASDYLRRLSDLANTPSGDFDRSELHRVARALRGTAHIAREEHVFRAALGLESATLAIVEHTVPWNDATRSCLTEALATLRDLAVGPDREADADARVAAVLDQLRTFGPPAPPVTAAEQPAVNGSARGSEFHAYVAAEVVGIANVLDSSVSAFTRDPMDRAALRAVLRRHRALLGAARLEEIGIVAETLRAIEEIAGIITKLDTPIKVEWLDVFRCARDVLRGAVDPLRQGNEPRPSTALSRLRTLRTELVDRYGAVVAPPAPIAPEALLRTSEAAGGSAEISELTYSGSAALRRALELRPRVEKLLGTDPAARELIDELFDLIRLGLE